MTELKKGDLIELEVTDLNNLGNGVGRYNGQVIFVRGAVSGDKIKAKIIKVNSNFAVARLEEILEPSEFRAESDFCTAPLSCGGCVYRHITYEHELELKRNYVKNAFVKAGLPDVCVLPVLSALDGDCRHYRNKGQYPLTKTKNGVAAGFYASKTHNIIPCDSCAIQSPEFAPIIRYICSFADKHNISVYNEENGKGLLRHVYLRIGEASGEIMLCLVINGNSLPFSDGLCEKIRAEFPSVVSIMLNKNTENTNVVLGKEYINLYGKGGIEDTLCGLSFFISPDSFYQVNRRGAELLYAKAKEAADLSGDEVLCDLYCGTGTIGLSMADKVSRVCGIEIVSSAVECAEQNAKRNGIENAVFMAADAGNPENILKLTEGKAPDVVILDPPRKGSTKELIGCLAELGVKKVVYVSCDPDTLARDAANFVEYGYEVGDVTPVDMFPRTGHVESVVCLTR